jgi:Flp pilus assembly protein TadG
LTEIRHAGRKDSERNTACQNSGAGAAAKQDRPGMLRVLRKLSRRGTRELARFCQARSGATAVEFAIISPAFIALLIAILQTAYVLFAQQMLQTAAVEAGRLFMTGQGPATSAKLTDPTNTPNICSLVTPIMSCSSVMVDVEAYSGFSGANTSQIALTYNGQGQVSNTFNYTPGTPGQVVIVKLIYQLPVINGPLGFMLANLPQNMREIMGITAIRVEPY